MIHEMLLKCRGRNPPDVGVPSGQKQKKDYLHHIANLPTTVLNTCTYIISEEIISNNAKYRK